jgi:hypothetical protein
VKIQGQDGKENPVSANGVPGSVNDGEFGEWPEPEREMALKWE